MNKRRLVMVCFLPMWILSACGGDGPEPTFDIVGTPDPLYYGGACGTPVITFHVKGFLGDPYPIYSTYNPIVAYQLFDGGGKEVKASTLALSPVAFVTPDAYSASQGLAIPDTGAYSAPPDSLVLVFGEGTIKFQAILEAEIRTSPTTVGPRKSYFTTTKSIPVLPCSTRPPTAASTVDPGSAGISGTIIPPGLPKPPNPGGGNQPPGPPSCSVEPNNPNCVNP